VRLLAIERAHRAAMLLLFSPKSQFKDLLEKKRRELDRAITQERMQLEKRSKEKMLSTLKKGNSAPLLRPPTAPQEGVDEVAQKIADKQISGAVGLTDSTARHRARQVGGVWAQGCGCWRLAETE